MLDYVTLTRRLHPLTMESVTTLESPGQTVADLVAASGLDGRFSATVTVARGESCHPVPENFWRVVKPKAGSVVCVCPVQGRDAVSALAVIAIAVAAAYTGGAAFGAAGTFGAGATGGVFGTSALGVSLVTAGVTVAGSLLMNQLLAPPQPRLVAQQSTAPRYDIGGSGNRAALYEPVPLVVGRHQMFPVKTATPYTSTNGTDVWLYERMSFGYGPVALETLKIGETPIEQFSDVQIEFRNVDRTQTLARYPGIGSKVTAWRSGGQAMTLHPDDIIQDAYNVELTNDVGVVRTTRTQARRIEVEYNMPNGIWNLDPKNGMTHGWGVRFVVEIRPVGTGTWTMVGNNLVERSQREALRWVIGVNTPSVGQYDVRVRALFSQPVGGNALGVYLSAIRTVQSGKLPSQPELAEVALRIRASEQLNGPIDTLSAVTNRMVPKWNGTTWTQPQVTSHPAWHLSDLLRGPMRRHPVPDAKIDRAGLKAWADQEPERRCDYVADSAQSVRSLGDAIAAAGRAKFDFNGRYRIIRDQANGPVRQVFTPRNSWGFSGNIALPKPLHALRVQFMSEALNWQMDEMIVYADGYNAGNATIIEPLELVGVMLRKGEKTGGEVWRLARYHIAQHKLRFETFTLSVDLEHLVTGIGDKVRIVHDMPSIGIGQGRVKSRTTSGGNIATLTLDEVQDVAAGTYHLTIRGNGGEIFEARATGGNLSPDWTLIDALPAGAVTSGEIVAIREISTASFDCIIKRITALDDLQATLELLPASPGVLTAEDGIIPPYDAAVSRADRSALPAIPHILRAFSGPDAVDASGPFARVGVEIVSQSTDNVQPLYYRVRWRPEGGGNWKISPPLGVANTLYTGAVDLGGRYHVSVQAVGQNGGSRGWSAPVAMFASINDGPPPPPTNLRVNVLGLQVSLTWDRPGPNVDYYEVRHSTDPDATWGESVTLAPVIRQEWISAPAFNGVYHVRSVNYEGDVSVTSATIVVTSGILNTGTVTEIEAAPDWTGTLSGAALVDDDVLLCSASANNVHDWTDVHDVADVHTTGAVPQGGTFELAEIPEFLTVETVRVSAEIRGGATYPGNDVHEWSNVHDIEDVHGAADFTWSITPQISLTDDSGGSPTWGPWQDLLAGDYRFRQARFRLVMTLEDELALIQVDSFTIKIGEI